MPGPAPPPRRVDGDALLAGDAAARDALASSVRTRGFAVLRLAAPTAAPFVAGVGAARAFFRLPPQQKEATRQLFDEARVGAKGLVGYNVVTPAKSVFRIRRRREDPDSDAAEGCGGPRAKRRRTAAADETAAEVGTVWPDAQLLPDFRRDVEAAWSLLERLLACAAAAILGDDLHARWEERSGGWVGEQAWSASPLDLFHYPNDEVAGGTINCTEHKDPGLLSLIPCTPRTPVPLSSPCHSLIERRCP